MYVPLVLLEVRDNWQIPTRKYCVGVIFVSPEMGESTQNDLICCMSPTCQ